MVEVVDNLGSVQDLSHVYSNRERVQLGDTSFCGHFYFHVLKKLDEGFGFQTIINNLW